MTKSDKDVEIIRGDGIWLTMDSNQKLLEIMGDGCKINLAKNYGMIRVFGDGCRLKVIQNFGSIEYNGDGGRVDLGPDSNKERVTFSGHGGHLRFLNEKPAKAPRGNQGNVVIENKEDISSNLKENKEQKKNRECENDNCENERRERRRKLESNSKRGSTVIVTKTVNANGECKTNVRTFYEKVDPTRS